MYRVVLLLVVACVSTLDAHFSESMDLTCQYYGHEWTSDTAICNDGTLHVGDFNGDHRDDLLCVYPDAATTDWDVFLSRRSHVYENVDYTVPYAWCDPANNEILIGDFNGDHHDDILCHNPGGTNTIRFIEDNFVLGGIVASEPHEYDTDPLCPDTDHNLYVGDFDGNGVDDLFCHNTADGLVYIKFGGPRGHLRKKRHVPYFPYPYHYHHPFPTLPTITVTPHTHAPGWSRLMPYPFCHAANDKVLIGDVDGNGKEDAVCLNTVAQTVTANLAHYYGSLLLQGSTSGISCDDSASSYMIKADGNHHTDIFCLNGAVPTFYYDVLSGGYAISTDASAMAAEICAAGDTRLFADVNGDRKDDMICFTPHSTASAIKVYYNECPPP